MTSVTGQLELQRASLKTKIQRTQLPRDRDHHVFTERRQAGISQAMAGHESARTTGFYDRRSDEVALDEVERIAF